MTSEILSELRALSNKVDNIQSEISQLHKIMMDNLSIGQGNDSASNFSQPRYSFKRESVTPSGVSAHNSIGDEALLLNDDPKSPEKPATGICTEPDRDEEQCVNSYKCSIEENGTRSSCIPSSEIFVSGRTTQYSHRNYKEYREECLRKAIQQNIVLLVDNLPYSENDILDMLIEKECLTETESSDLLNNGSRKDRVRNLVRTIKGRPYKVVKIFAECVKTLHPEVAASIWQVYEKLIKDKKNYNRQCVFCVPKKSVDLKFLADHNWSVCAISDELYDEIVDGRTDKETLWTKLADEYNVAPSIIRQKALRKVTEALMKMGLYRELVLKLSKISFLKCVCVKIDMNMMLPLKRSSGSLKLTTTDCDETTTVSPVSTSVSLRSFADRSEIISDDDDFPVDEHENYFLSPWTAENDRVLCSSCFGLRKGSVYSQSTVDKKILMSRSNSCIKRGSVQPVDKRRASMFT